MKIAIIGGGSIGLLFAYYLSNAYQVTLYTRTRHQAKMIEDAGIRLIGNGENLHRKVCSNTFDQWKGDEELTFIAVKQYHLGTVLQQIKEKVHHYTNLVFLQNGMSHLKYIENIKNKNIFVSTVEHGAFKKNVNTVEHNGHGQTRVALFQGEMQLDKGLFSIPGFPIIYESDYYPMLIRKLVVNSIINPLTALLKVRNGEIVRNQAFYQAAQHLFSEIAAILELDNKDAYFELVRDVCLQTSENRSSMLKDMESNQLTEIDAILGYILDEAKRKKLNAPISEMLYLFIKGSER